MILCQIFKYTFEIDLDYKKNKLSLQKQKPVDYAPSLF